MTRYKHRCQLAVISLYFTVCIIKLMNFEEWLKEFCNLYMSDWIFFPTVSSSTGENIICAIENR